jgi:low affinity Fe/Cu permease
MLAFIRKALTWLGVLASRPVAFAVVIVYAILWATLSPQTLGWQGVVALSTWLMTVIIQRAEHRDTQAIHAKLDHLLAAVEKADPKLAVLDKLQQEEIERLREDADVSGNPSL